MNDIDNQTLEELQETIARVKELLKLKQRSKYKETIAQIKELAASIGVTVTIVEDPSNTSKSDKPVASVSAKYRNPNDPSKTWTGRGLPPKWFKALIDDGHDKNEFLILN